MNETTRTSENFIGYEYKEVFTTREKEGLYTDGYPSFGWKVDGSVPSALGFSTVNLRFKRDRKICNKAELTRLQRQFEAGIAEIEHLENSKTNSAFITAMSVGLVGTAFMAGSTFSFLGDMIPLMIILAIPAVIGWLLPYFLYKKVQAKRTATITPLIEKQYDTIYEACEKGHALQSE